VCAFSKLHVKKSSNWLPYFLLEVINVQCVLRLVLIWLIFHGTYMAHFSNCDAFMINKLI